MVYSKTKGSGRGPRGRRRGRTKAVVVIVTEELAVAPAAGETILGVGMHVEPVGAPEQLSVTLEAKPLSEVTVTEKLVEPPAFTVPCKGVSAIEKSGCPGVEPLPERGTR